MLVQEVMTKDVVTIDSNETAFDASVKYRDNKVGCLVVTDEEKCIGIVTERDIIERVICNFKIPDKTKVGDIMSSDIKTIHALENIEKAISIMITNKIKKLPVVKNDQIVGIITVTDISRARPEMSKSFIEFWVKPKWSG